MIRASRISTVLSRGELAFIITNGGASLGAAKAMAGLLMLTGLVQSTSHQPGKPNWRTASLSGPAHASPGGGTAGAAQMQTRRIDTSMRGRDVLARRAADRWGLAALRALRSLRQFLHLRAGHRDCRTATLNAQLVGRHDVRGREEAEEAG